MKKNQPSQASLEEDNRLHIVAKLAIADPKVIAQNLLYESEHGEKEILEALGKLLEANRNESGKNVASYVTTANHEVNKVPNYILDEREFAQQICSHLSQEQIEGLLKYNTAMLQNPEPRKEIKLIREVFGPSDIEKPGEGNSYLKALLEKGKEFAAIEPLPVPEAKPEIKPVKGSNMAVCMLSMCLKQGFLPLRKHDGSHVNSGFNNTVIGEIYNASHDMAQSSIAQYRVVPTLKEQMLNRKVIYSFEGLPQKIKGLKREWRGFVADAVETWRQFLLEHPEYIEKWKLSGLVDKDMRMVKPDGSFIPSTQTKEAQIPGIDYADLAVLHNLSKKVDKMLTDEEVYSAQPYDLLYSQALHSVDLLALEYIMRDGKPEVMLNGMLDSNATYKDVRYGQFHGRPELSDLSDPTVKTSFEKETAAMEKSRAAMAEEGKWSGYMVDLGQDRSHKMWVTDKPPELSLIYPGALTVYRVTVPKENIDKAQTSVGCAPDRMTIFDGDACLVDSKAIHVESALSKRDESRIPCIESKKSRSLGSTAGMNTGVYLN